MYLKTGPEGFEPPLLGPKPRVLPLDDGPIHKRIQKKFIISIKGKMPPLRGFNVHGY